MTTYEIFTTLIIYISLGLWICFKRNWYSWADTTTDAIFYSCIAIALMPLNLIIILFREFILKNWDN